MAGYFHMLYLQMKMISTELTKLRVKLDGEKEENAGDSSGKALEEDKDWSIMEEIDDIHSHRINQTEYLHPIPIMTRLN